VGVYAGALASAMLLAAQSHPTAGLEAPWDARTIIANVLQDSQRIKPLLMSLNPQDWYDKKGAPGSYILQWQRAQTQITDVEVTSKLFSQKPDSLSLALDVYFRLDALDTTARSVVEGAQKYGDRGVADKLSELVAHNFNSRERLRDYLRGLASSMEQNFKIADEEAQRCRGMISREAPPCAGKLQTRK
jgi:hypothetical protein